MNVAADFHDSNLFPDAVLRGTKSVRGTGLVTSSQQPESVPGTTSLDYLHGLKKRAW